MNTTNSATPLGGASVLTTLRSLLPPRRLYLSEAMRIAELQAHRLLELRDVTDVPVPVEIVTELPRVVVEYDPDLPGHAASGSSAWDVPRRAWIIALNPDEPPTRQRFTVLHEYKHIIDHYHPGLGGRPPTTLYGLTPVEYVAEYFAGCVLMPRRLVKAAYYDGIQRLADLAELFDVSGRAMEVRLDQLGLADPKSRTLSGPKRSGYRPQPKPWRGTYRRPLSQAWTPARPEEIAA